MGDSQCSNQNEHDIAEMNDIVRDSEIVNSEDEMEEDKRDRQYTKLLDAFIDYYGKKSILNLRLRIIYFWMSFSILILIVGLASLAIILSLLYMKNTAVLISTVLSALIGLVSSVIVLPTIIGKYLFPKNEDSYLRDFVGHMRDVDEHRRDQKNSK